MTDTVTRNTKKSTEGIIRLVPNQREVCPDMTQWLLDLAERYRNGDIRNIVIVVDDGEHMTYECRGQWRNKWHLLGAMEYARHKVLDD